MEGGHKQNRVVHAPCEGEVVTQTSKMSRSARWETNPDKEARFDFWLTKNDVVTLFGVHYCFALDVYLLLANRSDPQLLNLQPAPG